MHTKKLITPAAAAGTVLAAVALTLTACGSDSHDEKAAASTTAASATSTAATSTSAAADQDDQLALQLLDYIVTGDFSAVTEHFDSQMKQKLSAQDLESAWNTYQREFGSYQSHGDPQDVVRDKLTVVNIPLQMANESGEFRVSFNTDQTVAGLFFLKTGVPVS